MEPKAYTDKEGLHRTLSKMYIWNIYTPAPLSPSHNSKRVCKCGTFHFTSVHRSYRDGKYRADQTSTTLEMLRKAFLRLHEWKEWRLGAAPIFKNCTGSGREPDQVRYHWVEGGSTPDLARSTSGLLSINMANTAYINTIQYNILLLQWQTDRWRRQTCRRRS